MQGVSSTCVAGGRHTNTQDARQATKLVREITNEHKIGMLDFLQFPKLRDWSHKNSSCFFFFCKCVTWHICCLISKWQNSYKQYFSVFKNQNIDNIQADVLYELSVNLLKKVIFLPSVALVNMLGGPSPYERECSWASMCLCVQLPPLQWGPPPLCCWWGPTWKRLRCAESEITEKNLQSWSPPITTRSFT